MFESLIEGTLLLNLGYTLVLGVCFFECTPLFGSFIPGQGVLVFASALSATGSFNPFILFLLAVIAAFSGDGLSWYLGKKYGIKLSHSKFMKSKSISKAERFLKRHEAPALIIGRLNSLTRAFVPMLVGINKSKSYRTLIYILISAIVWAFVFVLLGYLGGKGILFSFS